MTCQQKNRPGGQKETKKEAGRKQREELKAAGLTWGTAARRALDRVVWRGLMRALCATRHEEDKYK